MKTSSRGRSRWGIVAVCGVFIVSMLAAVSLRAQSASPIQVNVGEAVTVPADNVTKLAIADPAVADVVPLSDKEISVIGKKVGATTLTIVRSEGLPTEQYRVDVGNDSAAAVIREMVGSPNITVRAIGDTLVLDGKVNDEIEAQRAVQVASAYKGQVVNLLEVSKPRQIKIRTRVAEVNTDAIRNIGFRWLGPAGEVQYAMNYQGGGSIISGFVPPASTSGTTPLSFNANAVTIDVVLQLLLVKGYARLLSEPTLTTFSGKEASFLVGQEIPIVQQLPQSFTVEFKEVGVRMKIKPTADSENRITTTVHSEVSQVIGSGSQGIPIIGTKMADSTIQVNDGQTVVIGGLLENNIDRDVMRKVPWMAEIPIFGFLFRHKEFHQAQREVLFFLTPEVIKDIDADTAGAAKTPYMRQWMGKDAFKHILVVPSKSDNWGLHRPDGMGLAGEGLGDYDQPILGEPGQPQSKAPAKPAAAKPPTAKPAASPNEPTTNFAPARPAVSEAQPAHITSAPVQAPEAAEPSKEPTTNYGPARPAGN
jgi:pilus assembly protein CpaC